MPAPVVVAAIGGMLLNLVPTLVGRVLIALGVGVATFTGADVTMDWLKALFLSHVQSLPPNVVAMLALMKIGVAVNMMISAIVVRMTINGLSSGTFKRWVLR